KCPAGAPRPACLDARPRPSGREAGRLKDWTPSARQTTGQDLLPLLLAHWITVGNLDGAWLARKEGGGIFSEVLGLARDPGRCRQLEPLLLASSRYGYLPAYGLGGPRTGHNNPNLARLSGGGVLVSAG